MKVNGRAECYDERMNAEERATLKQVILREMEEQRHLIESLARTTKPVAPDKAIGRLTRMEAINSKSISEANLSAARAKLAQLEKALGKVNDPGFGVCARCAHPIPHGRILLMPESVLCVRCAEKR